MAIPIGSRLELFVDSFLVDRCDNVRSQLHHPVRQEVVLRTELPHEYSNLSSYQCIIRHDGRYLMYYRGGKFRKGFPGTPDQKWVYCVAVSEDGIHWERPMLNLHPSGFNVVLDEEMASAVLTAADCVAHATVFRDDNPACPPDERVKLLLFKTLPPGEVFVFVSRDGFDFHLRSRQPGRFKGKESLDSQNLAFYDAAIDAYRFFGRGWHIPKDAKDPSRDGFRCIRSHQTKDFKSFTHSRDVVFDDGQPPELYTNQIQPYFRAPHILLGFPMRYCDARSFGPGFHSRPGYELRRYYATAPETKNARRVAAVSTDTVLISSRDGVHFHRQPGAFIAPGPLRSGSWFYHDTFTFAGFVQSPSALGDAPDELSFFITENSKTERPNAFRRCTLRLDGFVSLDFPPEGGEVITKPLTFTGHHLVLNLETTACGFLEVSVLDAKGYPLSGWENSYPLTGDDVNLTVLWKKHGSAMAALRGKPIRLRFHGAEASLYSFQFQEN